VSYDPKIDKKLTLYIASSWPKWQDDLIKLVSSNLEGLSLDVKKIMPKVSPAPILIPTHTNHTQIDKKNKKAMPFIMSLKRSLDEGKSDALERKLPFDEAEVIEHIKPALAATVYRCREIEVVSVDPNAGDLPVAAQGALPGNPGIDFVNI
jgi:leucyl-tRNA synthetase